MLTRAKTDKLFVQAAVWALVVLVLFTGSTLAQFQRMMLFPGKYVFSGKGGRLPAYCVDLKRPRPVRSNSFGYIAGNVTFQKLDKNGTPLGRPIPVQTAIEKGEIRFDGAPDGSIRSFDVRFPKLAPDEQARIDIEDFALAAQNKADSEKPSDRSLPATLRSFEEQRTKLVKAFGETNELVMRLTDQRNAVIWGAKSSKVFDALRDTVADLREEQTLEKLAILHGRPLTAEQIRAVNDVLRLRLDSETTYTKHFLEGLQQFAKARQIVQEVFGETHPNSRHFVDDVFKAVGAGASVRKATQIAVDQLIPPMLHKQPKLARSMLALAGTRLTDTQAKSLSDIVGVDLTGRDARFKNVLLISQIRGERRVLLNTVDRSEMFALDEVTPALIRSMSGNSGRIIVDGPIDALLAERLNAAGIYFFRDAQTFLREPSPQPVRAIRLIMIAAAPGTTPEERQRSREMNGRVYELGGDQRRLDSVQRGLDTAAEAGATFVRDRGELASAIRLARKNGELPIVFFHNAGNRLLFPTRDGTNPMSFREFHEALEGSNGIPISCDTFSSDVALPVRTSTYLFVESFARAAQDTIGMLRSRAMNDEQVLNTLGARYAARSNARGAVIALSLAGGAGGTVLLGVLISSLTQEKKDKDDKNDPPNKKIKRTVRAVTP